MGMGFLQKTKLHTENKHLLVECPSWFGNMPTLKWIGSPQANISFCANGHELVACADTRSDLNFMSLKCAKQRGFKADRTRRARARIRLADGSASETVGTVHISSVEVGNFDSFEMDFHVLPGLPCDIVFSEEFLEQRDAFNTCSNIIDTEDPSLHGFKTLISLGPIQAFLVMQWSKIRKRKEHREEAPTLDGEVALFHRNKRKHSVTRTLLPDQTEPPSHAAN